MSTLTLVLIALGVSADAFAVSVGKGLHMRRLDLRTALTIALAFGVFQGVMPVIGWLLGSQVDQVIEEYDHWVAFGLLAAVGGKMLHEAFQPDDERDTDAALGRRELLVLSVATSIDALAVGISFAFLPISIVPAALLIGVTTFVVSFAGVVIGHRAGARLRGYAEVVGGLVLIAIGLRILLDHLGVI